MKLSRNQFVKAIRNISREKLPSVLRKIFKDPANIGLFSEFFFDEVLTNKSPEFHKEIYEILFKNSNDAIAAPRGHAKSTITGLIFLIFNIVNKTEKYVVYVSQNHSKTTQFISPIRYEFKNNIKLRYVYGDLTPKSNKDDDGKDREDCFDVGGCRIEAVSFERNMRGFKYNNIRPTLIIGDDIESDERVLNPDFRVRDAEKLNKVIIPSLDINGRFKFIGTILHVNSLLKKKIDQYNGKIYQACSKDFKNILWEDRFTENKLREIQKDIGVVAFEQEYLNNPINTTNSIIKREWLEKCTDSNISYNDKFEYSFKTMGVDFAFSDRISADKSAFVSLGKIKEQFICFSCLLKKGLSISEQMKIIEEFHEKNVYDVIGLEENSIRGITNDIRGYNMPLKLFWTGANDPAERKKADYDFFGKRQSVGKINLIMRLATAIEHEEIVFPYKTREDKDLTEEIFSECISYALSEGKLVEAGVHPDIPMGLGYALELMKTHSNIKIDYGDINYA